MTLNKYSASYIINYVLDTYWVRNSVLLPSILTFSSFTLLSTKGCKNNILKSAASAVSKILTSPPYTANFHVIQRHLLCVQLVEIKILNKTQITQNRFCFAANCFKDFRATIGELLPNFYAIKSSAKI